MGLYREQDPLAALLKREHARVLECLKQYDGGAGAISVARRVLRALAVAELDVLYPAFSRVALRLETRRLLDDCLASRAEQLTALDVLARRRAPRLRKLSAVVLCDRIEHHGEQHISLLIPVLASQLPRVVYRSIVHAFAVRFEEELERLTHDGQVRHEIATFG